MIDRYAFLDPWTQVLPEAPGAVIAVAGSGGKTTLLRRLWTHYRQRGHRVLWTQMVPHAAPVAEPVHSIEERADRIRASWSQHGSLVVVGPAQADGRHGGIDPAALHDLRSQLSPHVTLVEAHTSTGTPLRQDDVAPLWPEPVHLAFLVAHLGAVGRRWGPSTVAGATTDTRDTLADPRRVTVEDVLDAYDPRRRLLADLPSSCAPLPFLTGLGAFRDMDGMFVAVDRLWSIPRVRLVFLAELLGDERRDAADLRDLPAAAQVLGGERVYALYPAHLDDGT